MADDVRGIHIDDGNRNAADTRNKNSGSIWEVSVSSRKQEKVGTLSFSVTDASSTVRVDQRPKQAAQEGAGSSAKASPEQKTPVKKSTARAKVPFEKGYSQMDWLKLTRTHPDLAGSCHFLEF